jgi:hypothetical protein
MLKSQPYTCIIKALENKYNLSLDGSSEPYERQDANIEWSHNCMVTQDWDELNEFIYTNELTLAEDKKPLYFDPHAKWGCLFLPKIKIRWASRIKQIKLGHTIFNMLEGKWDSKGAFNINIINDRADGITIKIYPYHGTDTQAGSASICLIPFKNYICTQIITNMVPELCIVKEKLECVYAAIHVNVSFNRQGLYINRKYREKTEYLNPADLPSDYRIIEPAAIEFELTGGKSLLKLRL